MLQLHLSYRQLYCQLRYVLYYRLDGIYRNIYQFPTLYLNGVPYQLAYENVPSNIFASKWFDGYLITYCMHHDWTLTLPFDGVNDEISIIKGHVLTLTRLFFAHWRKSGLFIIWLNVLNTIYIIQYPIVTFNYVKYTVLVHQHERWWLHVYVFLFFSAFQLFLISFSEQVMSFQRMSWIFGLLPIEIKWFLPK